MARESLNDLIVAGFLKPGDELTCEPTKGKLYRATVAAGGRISYQGELFDSPSQWATEVAKNQRNGWRDVYFNGIPLTELRKKLRTLQKQKVVVPEIPGEQIAQTVEQQLHAKLLNLAPPSFEKVVGKVLEALGLTKVNVSGKVADRGIDGDATVPVLNMRVGFQAKRYTPDNKVAGDDVRALVGTVVTNKYDRGILITTSSFTAAAQEEAAKPDSRIVLIDGQSLVRLMIANGIGIRRVPVTKAELNGEFFTGLTSPGA